MGGLSFIIAFIFAFLCYAVLLALNGDKGEILPLISIVIFALLNCLVGIIDDLAKIKKRKNEGLKPASKLILQAVSAIILLTSLSLLGIVDTVIKIPFLGVSWDLGIFYYVIAFFVICGFINAVNLTDGIDGLASSVSLTSGIFICVVAVTMVHSHSLVLIGSTIIGVSFAFLFFNLHPAKIFMGDTGSLFLGALIVGASFFTSNFLIIVFYGFIFLCEAVSVMLQVTFFKISKGRRIFKMTPLHHHFEKSGWSEMKIVSIFTLINAIFCILAYLSLI